MANSSSDNIVSSAVVGVHDVMSNVSSMLRTTRLKLQQERTELMGGIAGQIRELRLVQLRLQHDERDIIAQLSALSRRLDEADIVSASNVPSKELQTSVADASKRLTGLQEQLKLCSEETELVKAGLLNDRVTREERRRLLEAEDEELEMRLRHVEETHDSLRVEVQKLREGTIRSNEQLQHLVNAVKEDAPMQYQRRLNLQMLENMKDEVRLLGEKYATLAGRMECVEDFSHKEEEKRRVAVNKIESTLFDMEKERTARHARPALASRTLDFAAGVRPGAAPSRAASEHKPGAGSLLVTGSSNNYHSSTSAHHHSDRSTNKKMLIDFYSKYNPSKIANLDAIMAEYHGAMEELFAALELHYGAFGYFSNMGFV